jgi:iron complex transport system ATP-binding protein
VTAVIALHDLNLAAMFCDFVLVLQRGRVVAGGSPADVLTPTLIADVYGVRAHVARDHVSGRVSVAFQAGTPSGSTSLRLAGAEAGGQR